MSKEIYTFISYSREDIEFARKLDATLANQGVSVFLDERDIKVGESFPARIYDSISQATHLLYIISRHSVKSKWVQEELQTAKVRQLSGKGLIVLPILIEEMEPPPSIAHIHYADMTKWKTPEFYLKGVEKILLGLGFEHLSSSNPEVEFFLENMRLYLSVLAGVNRFAGYAEGAKNADYLGSERRGEGVRGALKWDTDYVEGSKMVKNGELKAFIDLIRQVLAKRPSTILHSLAQETEKLFERMDQSSGVTSYSYGNQWESYNAPEQIKSQAIRLSLMLEELTLELISITQSQLKRPYDNATERSV